MLVTLLLVAHAAAEWVEISQHHYHYTKKPARTTPTNTYLKDVPQTTRNPYQDKEPTRNIYPYLDESQTRKTYRDQDDHRNTYRYDGVSIKDIFPDDDIPLQNPKRNNFEDVQPVRVNPFLQESTDMDTTRNTYIYQDSSQRNTYQNMLQKPLRDDFLNQDVPFKIPSRETFLNHSITEHKWNQNLHRQNNVRGNKNTHPTNERNDRTDEKRKQEDRLPDITRVKDETVSGKIERVPNVGSVKRVQLENTPVKSPALYKNISKNSSNRRNYELGTPNDDDLDLITDNFNSFEAGVSMKPSNMFKHVISSIREDPIQIESKNKVTKTPALKFHKQTFTAKPGSDIDEAKQHEGNIINQQKNVPELSETSVNRPSPQSQFTSKEDLPDLHNQNKKILETKEEVKINDAAKINKNQSPTRGSVKFEQKESGDKENSSEGEKINTSGEVKVNTMENILKFMKIVAETIAKNTRRGTSGKITYLNELKNTLLDNIKERIDATWPDDTSASTRRQSRAASPRGHVEFPSSESSLMTISFLTFAVFLIKLVLQVIQAYKHKTMLMAPLMVATAGRTASQKLSAS